MSRGNISRQIVTALQDSPKTIGQLASIVYGDDDMYSREAARMAILRLRKSKSPVESEWLYIYRGGQLHDECDGDIARRFFEDIRSQPKSATELALAVYQDDSRVALKRAYSVIDRLRKDYNIKIDAEMRYRWNGDQN